MSVQIRVLAPGDDRGQFSSGNPDLDRFFQRFIPREISDREIAVNAFAARFGKHKQRNR